MFIAVTSTTEELDGIVPKTFEESPFLMIIDADKNQVIKIYGKQDEKNMVFAQKVLDHDCEAIICGPIEKDPFELMAGKMVSRYDGSGHTVERAYKYMVQYRLDLIRDYIGGPGAVGLSHDFSFECVEGEAEE